MRSPDLLASSRPMFAGDQRPVVTQSWSFSAQKSRTGGLPRQRFAHRARPALERTRSHVPLASILGLELAWRPAGQLLKRRTAHTGCGETMKYVLLVLAIVFAVDVSSARADPILTFQ